MKQDYDWSRHTPADNTGESYNISASAMKNIRFTVSAVQTYLISAADMANLPGIAYKIYGDTSLWRIIMAYNGFSDAIQDIQVGIILQLPAKAAIMDYVTKHQNQQQLQITI